MRALGIGQLACVIGNSMGGMTALAYLLLHPGASRGHINVSGSARALPFSIAIRSLQREAIRLDPAWNHGNYDDGHYPENGMRMARKLGVVTYRSAMEWDGRFGRVRLDSECREDDPFGLEFEVERYLEGHALRFVRQFDPNCYLYLSRSMDWFDLAEYAKGDVLAGLARIRVAKSLSIGVHTDILFPAAAAGADRRRAAGRRRGVGIRAIWIRRRATMPSWSTSKSSARSSPDSWRGCRLTSMNHPDFRGREALLAVIDAAYAQGNDEALTHSLRDGLCRLISEKRRVAARMRVRAGRGRTTRAVSSTPALSAAPASWP